MARIPYPDPAALSAPTRSLLELVPPLNIFRMLAHAESLAGPYGGFGVALLTDLQLDTRLRELAVLQVARQAEAEYEWVQHVPIARAAGVGSDLIEVVRRGDLDSDLLTDRDRAVLRFTEQVVRSPRVEDDTFRSLAAHLTYRQIVELLLVVGNYLMLARIMTCLDLEPDRPVESETIDAITRSAGTSP